MTDKDIALICLTPVKNESWILERFLTLASQWADYIVVMDQCSNDGSRKKAKNYEKVVLIENEDPSYDEAYRQRTLIETARKLPGRKKIFIALDADEALTANWKISEEWDLIKEAELGTVLVFNWINLIHGEPNNCDIVADKPYGFVDDGKNHIGSRIHSTRIPFDEKLPRIELEEIGVLHFADLAPFRAVKKRVWYQCWERVHHPEKRAVQVFRYYNKHLCASLNKLTLRREWIQGFQNVDFDIFDVKDEEKSWWEKDVLLWFEKYGLNHFRKLDIWDEIDWQLTLSFYKPSQILLIKDPRSKLEKSLHRWLRKTQGKQHRLGVRVIQKMVSVLGW